MTKKRKTGQKLPKGESLYEPTLAGQAKTIILELQPIKANGELHYAKIAKVLNIPFGTFNMWRAPKSKYYKPEFAKALVEAHEELTESIELGKTKKAMIARSQPHTLIKRIKELRIKGPKVPPLSGMDKKALIIVAKKLGVKIAKKMTNGLLKIKITEAVEEQTEEKLVLTRQEEQRSLGNTADGKHVTANLGPKEKRWVDKQELAHSISEELSNLLGLIDGSSKGKLPDGAEGQDAG